MGGKSCASTVCPAWNLCTAACVLPAGGIYAST